MTNSMKSRITASATVVLAASALTFVAGASPAQAETVDGGCSTPGGFGSVQVEAPGGAVSSLSGILLHVSDSARDDAHMRVRLVTEKADGRNVYYKWRKLTTGFNTHKVWETSARDSNGIFHVGVQIARFRGNTYLNHCSEWAY